MFGKRISCTINPSFELENEDTLTEAEVKKNVLVIGGGPAGMEAAFVAKKRGHHVVLCEATAELGGALHVACVPIGKQELTKVVQFFAHRIEAMGVDIRLNTPVTKEMLEGEFAEYLAPLVNDRFVRNRDITVLEMAPEILMNESGSGRSVLVQRMMAKGVHIECGAKVTAVTEDTITYEQNGAEHVIADADTLVFANGYHVDSTIEEMLKAANTHYHLIGDGEKVGNLRDAITRAYEVVKNI